MGTINGAYMTNAGSSTEKMDSQKKMNTLRRTTAHAHKKNVKRAIGLNRGRSAALRTGYPQTKPVVFMGVYSMNTQRRLKKLQMLIPGGRSMKDVDVLFKKTEDYIVSLKMQVALLQALCGYSS